MKHAIVFGFLVLLIEAQLGGNDFPIECYSRTGDTVYLQFICVQDQHLVTIDGCLNSNQYDNSSVKLIRYACRSPIPSLTLYLDVLNAFENLNVLDIQNLSIEKFVITIRQNNRTDVSASYLEFKSQISRIQTLKASHNEFTQFPNSLLDHMPQITEIDYSFNKIQVVDFTQFTKSNNILSVNFSNNNIWNINKGSFANLKQLETLDLSHNHLRYFSDALFAGNENLKLLYLRNNFLDKFIIFTSLHNLQTLDLSNSHIQTINDHTFANNHKLINLNLGNSLLKNLKATFISSLNMLEKIDVSNTKIEEIDDDCFINNPNMKMLNLEGTSMNKFNFNTFSSKAKLVEVHLPSRILELDISCAKSICHFKQFDEKDYFENIQVFNVSGNRQQNVAKLLGKIGSNVKTLDLSWNSIQTLNVSMLEPFPHIRHLNLSHSQISNIGNDTFIRQFNLINLDLSYNLLKEIDSVKLVFSSLQTLDLVSNKLSRLGMVNSNNLPKLRLLKISENLFGSSYLYNTLNEWVKNGLEIDVELIQPATTQKTTTIRKSTKKPKPRPTTPTKTTTIEITTSADSTSTSTSPPVATTESDESSGKNTNSIQPTQVYFIIGGVFIIIIVIVAMIIWYICRKVSAQVVGTSVSTTIGTGVGTSMTTVPADEIGFIEPAYEEIKEPMQLMQTLPSAYAVGNIQRIPHYENAPTHTTTLDRYQFQNHNNTSLQSNEYATIYHHYATVSKPRPKRFL
ncbi:leucine-rich repeat-containing G-protein coupled receptor 4-like [Sitodiplosis mosellana]|uniref:leucine-rich repeat-containing G-protein coupled receptor 4-like n=1 Tax=Sitodiplosis mosellana TaxID=263140 RepID=UPI002443CC96|nr:leucine-rich repeat-containing G-protein coupled receptor 4-like [Sitodiplosis mosellana]